MSKILITGGSGLVGTRLKEWLIEKNHEVVILSRNPKKENEFKWDISNKFIDEKAFENIDYVVHLAGAGIADKRWSKERKKVLINSRVDSANLIFNFIKDKKINLKGFISASGIGYYGAKITQKIFEENDIVGNDFLAKVCQEWEDAANQFKQLSIPVTILRTGIVLSKTGGALKKMKNPIISPLGTGKQFLPWIHIDDLCEMYIRSIDNELIGIFNAVAPEHHNSRTFSKALAKSISRPYIEICVPSIMLKLLFGELAIILLEGSRISAKKIEKNGYSFRFKTLQKAFDNLY